MACHDPCVANPATSIVSRRSIVAALASAAVLSAPPFTAAGARAATHASADDERYMHLALDEARQGDFPFGAVIVRDGRVLARGRDPVVPDRSAGFCRVRAADRRQDG